MRSTLEMCYQIINQYSGNLHLQLTLQRTYINIPNIKPETLRTLNILVPYNHTLFGSYYIYLVEVKILAPRLSSHRNLKVLHRAFGTIFSVITEKVSIMSTVCQLVKNFIFFQFICFTK